MKKVPAGAFKARCLTIMKEVQSTGEPVVVTKRGKPVVKVMPIAAETNSLFGFMKGESPSLGILSLPFPSSGRS